MSELPTVTVIIPTLNESEHIDGTLESVASQTYPSKNVEVLVIDGGSADNTVALATSWSDRIPRLRVLHNPGRIQAAALNIGLEEAGGEVIVRMDAHTTYAPDYVERSVVVLSETGADVVGGPMRPFGTTRFQRAVAIATSTPLGVGPGRFHYTDEREEVDTLYLSTARRDRIVEAGGYDESFAVGEDHELNFRITKSGGRIIVDPTIVSRYTPRSSVASLARQYFRYGRSKVQTMRKHGHLPTWRPVAPAILVAVTAASIGASIVAGPAALVLVAAYAATVVAVSLVLAKALGLHVAVAIFTMHYSYGFGFWTELIRRSRPSAS